MSRTTDGSGHEETVRQSFRRQVGQFDGPDAPFARLAEAAPTWVGALDPNSVVLDMACGAAHVSQTLAPFVRQVVGVDLTPELLALGAARLRDAGVTNVLLQEANVERLPFVDESFDVVVCRAALHHFADPRRALAEARRVTRVGGRLVMSDMVVTAPDARDRFDDLHRALDPSHVRCFTADELRAACAEPGASVVHDETSEFRAPVDIAITELSDGDTVVDALRAELAGGPKTGFGPVDADGSCSIVFVIDTVHAVRGA
jgi:ubiquinone/menaquinone biosynthesis C-methylase UbiE